MATKKNISVTKAKANMSVPEEPEVKSVVRFPRNLLNPIGHFLSDQINKLEFRKKTLEKEDPFQSTARLSDNAALDADATEQLNHARVSAVQKQIDRQIVQMRKALARVKIGKYGICESCGEMIDTDRLMIYPEATFCVKCEANREK